MVNLNVKILVLLRLKKNFCRKVHLNKCNVEEHFEMNEV